MSSLEEFSHLGYRFLRFITDYKFKAQSQFLFARSVGETANIMKINQSPFLLFLLPAISAVLADTYNDNIDSKVSRETVGNNARLVDSDIVASNVAKGAPDVPVDGKDGRPHAGPWVETNADRDRTGLQGGDDVDPVSVKYDTNIPSSEHLSTEEGKMIPHSNGGVMDDPHRAGPKEGTRGTEGGVSEKGKESQLASEKVPGGPKEAPPLPHSETKKLGPDSDDTTTGGGSRSAEGPGSLGMLGVSLSLCCLSPRSFVEQVGLMSI